MSDPLDIPSSKSTGDPSFVHSPPVASPGRLHGFLIPSPMPTRDARSSSHSEKARSGPLLTGRIKTFCRNKGHGFIIPHDRTDPLFVHISDIDGDFVPKEGDEVSYKLLHIPPKFEKVQAVHVNIIKPAEGVEHETWDKPKEPAPITPSPH